MAISLHTKLGVGEVHVPFQWVYADEAAREAATGFTADDLHKLALQEDSHTLWLLIQVSPPLWTNIGVGTTGLANHVAIFDETGGVSYDSGNLEYYWDAHQLLVGTQGDNDDWEGRIGTYGSYDAYLPQSLVGSGVTQMPGTNGSSSRGTGPAPEVLQAGDLIARHGASMYTGSPAAYKRAGSLRWAAEGSSANLGSRIAFRTKPDGADEPIEAMRINSAQRLLIGQTSDTGEKLQVTGDLKVTGNLAVSGTTPPDTTAVHKATAGEIAAMTEKTTPVAADLVMIEDSAASNAKKKVQASNLVSKLESVFGSQAQCAESLAESSTGTTDFSAQKLRITTPSLPAGNYRIGVSFTWSHSTTQQQFKARVQVDDTTTIFNMISKPVDAGTTNIFPASGFACVALSAAAHTIDLDYGTSASGTAYIRDARLEIWRVS